MPGIDQLGVTNKIVDVGLGGGGASFFINVVLFKSCFVKKGIFALIIIIIKIVV